MRTLAWLALACGGGRGTAPVVANTTTTMQRTEPVNDAPADCTPLDDAQAKNAERLVFEDSATQRYGYKDKSGAIALPAIYVYAFPFNAYGVAPVLDGKYEFVFLDIHGRVLAHALGFDNGPDYFQEGLARIIDGKNKVGFMTERGEVAIAPTFDAAEPFCHDRSTVMRDGKAYVIDRRGRTVR